MRKLSELKIGEKGIIDRIESDELSIKLMEMGCIPGEEITLEQSGLTGDPISIKIADYQLSLRINEAALIWLTK